MIAYFDCYSGISGDMTLGALVDAGLPIATLEAELARLGISGYTLSAATVQRRGFRGTQVDVKLTETKHRRHLSDILQIIAASSLSDKVKRTAGAIFQKLAEAEAAVHGSGIEDVHFHEVGAVDAIVDIVGTAIGLEALGIDKVYAAAVPTGHGMIQAAHGMIPIPGPAVLELLQRANAPVYPGRVEAELTTPTGAAILTTLATFAPPRMAVKAVGYGFGQREHPWPNALRLWIGEPAVEMQEDEVCVIESNVDDSTPEVLGAVMEQLLARGALDVYFTPIQMKKNRPATKLSIIAPQALTAQLAAIVLEQTTSLGVRYTAMKRLIAQRWQDTVETPWGPVKIKVKTFGDHQSVSPEYDECLRLAREHNLPLQEVYEAVRGVIKGNGRASS